MYPFCVNALGYSEIWLRLRAQGTKEMHYRSLSQDAYLCLHHISLFNLANCILSEAQILANEPDIRNTHIISSFRVCTGICLDDPTVS